MAALLNDSWRWMASLRGKMDPKGHTTWESKARNEGLLSRNKDKTPSFFSGLPAEERQYNDLSTTSTKEPLIQRKIVKSALPLLPERGSHIGHITKGARKTKELEVDLKLLYEATRNLNDCVFILVLP